MHWRANCLVMGMRTIALRHPGHVSNRTFAFASVAICLALLAGIIALIVVRSHTRQPDLYVPIARDTQAERELRMGWTELGAVAAADPPPSAPAIEPNQSLPPLAVSPVASGAEPSSSQEPVAEAVNTVQSAAAPVAVQVAAVPVAPQTAPSAAANGPAPNAAPIGAAASPAPSANAHATPAQSDEQCGPTACRDGQVCCNASCGTCVEPGQKCSQAVCGMNASVESVPCGPNTCNTGENCCNASCGTCVKPGQTCDLSECSGAIQYPHSETCGMSTCNVGTVCCNPSCGICAAPGEACSQRACG